MTADGVDDLERLEEIDAELAEIEEREGVSEAAGAIEEARHQLAIARNRLEARD